MTERSNATQPNTDVVNGLVNRAKKITEAEAEKLAAAWDAAWGDERADAWDATWADTDAAWAGWCTFWDAWVAGAEGGAARNTAWIGVRAATLAAVQAVAACDLISDKDYETLVGPWESVMGPIFKGVDA